MGQRTRLNAYSFLVPRHGGSSPEVRGSPRLALWGLGTLEASLAPSRLGSTVVSTAADSVSLSSRFSNGVQGDRVRISSEVDPGASAGERGAQQWPRLSPLAG